MQDLKNTLIKFGLSPSAAEIYLAGLEIGPATILQLSKKSNIKRTTVYGLLQELEKFDLFYIVKDKTKDKFVMADPKKLKLYEHERMQELDNLLPELTALWKSPEKKPRIRFLDGPHGMMELSQEVEKVSEQTKLEYYHFFGAEKIPLKTIGHQKLIEFVESKNKKNIKRKTLINKKENWVLDYLKKSNKTNLQFKVLPENINIQTRAIFYGDRYSAFVSLYPEIQIVIIEDPEIYKMQKLFFNLLWEKS